MPTYLDFDTTKTFRNSLIARTLQRPNGPQTFTATNYAVQNLNDLPNIDPGDVDDDRPQQLQKTSSINLFKPNFYDIVENLRVLPRRANLGLYPYFTSGNYNLVGIMSRSDYENESEMFKFAASNIRNNPQGPVLGRLGQNLYTATAGRARFLEIFDNTGNQLSTLTNIITGREPLVEKNYKITVAKTLPGKAVDFLQTVAGVESPFSEIPGDYLTNPRNPINNRPPATSEAGAVLQDVTGVLGSLIGIQRRPKPTRKPSDLFIEYMGQGQRQVLYDNLSYSRYAPNYTTTARSQNSSKIFNYVDKAAQGVKNFLGLEAPEGTAYIGDDRAEDVKYTMSDFNDNVVKSSYYLSLLFDPVQANLFERQRNVSQGGPLPGKLTWLSKNSRNKIGLHNQEFQQFESNQFNDSKSTDKTFREGSILSKTQELLDSMPKDGIGSRTHVGNAIDQTSRIFKEGDSMLSRGSAIKYVDQFNQETGAEFCRVWTKDRSYFNYSDTMKRTANIRNFDGSVLGGDSRPWNINYAPMSSGVYDPTGKNSFGAKNSTNILQGPDQATTYGGNEFYAKKYMFSIENLAWRTSTTPGFTYFDLPYCERGSNGGRVMWFPPYDLKISENNSARWTDNTFLGRPEPIYTYQDTSRSGQLSFKVVVDHPSILNLLVREVFKGMSDDEADNYINAFFAGCEEVDFYDLITRYSTLSASDIQLVQSYLNSGKDPQQIKKYKATTEDTTLPNPNQDQSNNTPPKVSIKKVSLKYDNDLPGPNLTILTSPIKYTDLYSAYSGQQSTHVAGLEDGLILLSGATKTEQKKKEVEHIFNSPNAVIDSTSIAAEQNKLTGYFNTAKEAYNTYYSGVTKLKQDLENKTAQNITIKIESSASSVAKTDYNERLALRRSHSVIQDVFNFLTKSGTNPPTPKWVSSINESESKGSGNDLVVIEKGQPIRITKEYSFKDFGYDYDGKLVVISTNYGEVFTGPQPDSQCINKEFENYGSTPNPLKIYAPIAFFCRQSTFEMDYDVAPQPQPTPLPQPTITSVISQTSPTKKPPIDALKRVIMKTLSECFYFKKLEESDPVQFKSLRDKLKYFHPGFHSTTPEGLNARLTFLLQCIRPGDTIPIKGIADDTDVNARNTSFGPPPICVLRIGDFYHSKVVIRDVNISYDENVWDLNPEGIGVQPMIATVQMSLNFIGGQGLEKPIERLQNALSSNFFGNTEMYDDRSIPTNTTFNGIPAEKFTQDTLNSILANKGLTANPKEDNNKNTNNVNKNNFIGELSGDVLDYTKLVDDVYKKTDEYFKQFQSTYNTLYTKFGKDITTLQLSETYRPIKEYGVFTILSSTPGRTISLFGVPNQGSEIQTLNERLKTSIDLYVSDDTDNIHLTKIFGFDKVLDGSKQVNANLFLQKFFTKFVKDKFNELSNTTATKELETKRNELILAIDKVNFVVKYFKDSAVSDKSVFSNILTGFTSDFLYKEYEMAIDYVEKNTSRMYEDLGSNINFKSPIIDSLSFESIMSELLYSDVSKFESSLKVEDPVIFPSDVVNRMMKKVNNFISEPKNKTFKLTKFKNRTNGTQIKFSYSSTIEETNTSVIDEANLLHTVKSNTGFPINNKLNFYRPK